MKDLGAKLKAKREELGYTIEEMSVKTKIQTHYLKALESGDMDFFKEDASYLRYFVRFYCQSLQVDFEQIREEFENSIDDFNKTQSMKLLQERENKQQTINKRIADSKQSSIKVEKRKIDYSMLSLISVIVFMVVAIATIVIKMGPTWFATRTPQSTPPSVTAPVVSSDPTEDPLHTDEPTNPVMSPLNVTTTNGTVYEVRGWQQDEQVSIKIEFARETWMRISYNGVVSDNPASKIYQPEETMEILVKATDGLDITAHFGVIKDNKVVINGQEYELDSRVKDLVRGQQLHFVLKGE